MKNIKRNFTLLSLGFILASLFTFTNKISNKDAELALGAPPSSTSIPTTLNLNDNTESEVRSYYSSIDSLAVNERKGTNLLKNLKPILYNDMKYLSYDNVWKSAKITERNWTRSPASGIAGTYNASTGIVTGYNNNNDDPYIHVLYRNDNDTHNMKISSSHTDVYNALNREHIWPQSRGFKADKGASGPAGTDIHHLVIADARVNQVHHNNYAYGNVTDIDTQELRDGIHDNIRGTNPGVSGSQKVFEPQDSDKGDIARACLYMVARYNNYAGISGAISDFEPYLILDENYVTDGTAISSSDTTPASYASLNTLLAWHRSDPVDDYEIHRNNLIYRNFQKNRNPFIDFPDWVDCIWNNSSGIYATSSTDNCTSGNAATVNVDVTGISLNKTSTSLAILGTEQLIATISPSNASNTAVTWTSSNTNIATVNSSGLVSGVQTGSAIITATTQDGGFTATCTVNVTNEVQPSQTAILQYPGGTTTNMTGNDDANLVGLSGKPFTAVSTKGGSTNHIGLNTAGQLRLYYGANNNGNILTVTLTDISYKITQLDILFSTTVATTEVKVDGVSKYSAQPTASSTVTIQGLLGSAFTVQNVHGSNTQTWIKSITIAYEKMSTATLTNSLEVTGTLTTGSQYEGTTLDVAGLTIKAVYDDNSKVTLNESQLTLPILIYGTSSFEISYAEGEITATAMVSVTVLEDAIASISWTSRVTTYKEGNTLSPGVIEATRSSGAISDLTLNDVTIYVYSGTWDPVTSPTITPTTPLTDFDHNGKTIRLGIDDVYTTTSVLVVNFVLTTSYSGGASGASLVLSESNLSVGDEVLILAYAGTYAMSTTQNGNNRGSVAVAASDGTLSTVPEDAQILTLTE
ncbi:MAG: endonuclease, partial [Bacilli bacterium]